MHELDRIIPDDGGDPPFERVNAVLVETIANYTGSHKDAALGRLANAYELYQEDDQPLTKLMSLAFDLGFEEWVMEAIRNP